MTFIPGCTVSVPISSSPPRKTCLPPGSGPGLFVTTSTNGGVFASSTFNSLPPATAHTRLSRLAVITFKHFQLALHDLAIRLPVDEFKISPAAEDRISVRRAVLLKPGEVLVEHRLAQLFKSCPVARRILGAKQLRVDHLGQLLVAGFVQVHAIDRQGPAGLAIQLQAGREQINKRHLVGPRDLGHGGRVELDPLVVRLAVGQVAVVQILVRDRRKQHQPRRGFSVVLLAQRMLHELVEVRIELRQPWRPTERLVVAEECQNHVGPDRLEMLVRRAKAGRTQPQRQFVPREAEIAHYQLMPRKSMVQQRLKIPKMLHPIRQRIADNRNPLPRLQFQKRLVGSVCRGQRTKQGREQHQGPERK